MGNKRHFMERLMDAPAFAVQSLASQSILEVVGCRRVLIENHLGVKAYGHEKIIVQVAFGSIGVTGCDLELLRMTKEQLVITGTIQCIQLQQKEDV